MRTCSRTIRWAFGVWSVLASLVLAPLAVAGTWRVDDDAPPGGNGLTWPTAFRDLQSAIDEAKASLGVDDVIMVAQGTYLPSVDACPPEVAVSNRCFAFLVDFVRVTIQGGYAGIGAPRPRRA